MPATLRRPLDPSVCREILAHEQEGRLAYSTGRGRRAVPVHFNLGGDFIVFHAAAYNEIAQYVPGEEVSLELTHAPRPGREGWEIRVVGVAEPLDADPDDVTDETPEVWPQGVSWFSLRLPVTDISGSELSAR